MDSRLFRNGVQTRLQFRVDDRWTMFLNRVLFRVDAGPQIGLGHLQRSLSLATAFKRRDVESTFLINDQNGSSGRVAGYGFQTDTTRGAESWTPGDVDVTVQLAFRLGIRTVAVDSHRVSGDYLGQLRNAGLFVIARDDLALYPFPCQMVVNGNANACELSYRSSSEDTAFLLGLEYIVLPEELWESPPRAVPSEVQNVLVILGGADRHNLMPRILTSLDKLPGSFTVSAVIGPFFDNLIEVKDVQRAARHSIRLVQSPESVSELLLETDLAVSAAGQTLYELACVGCPTVALSVAPNQDGNLHALEAAGFIRSAGNATTSDFFVNLDKAVRSLLPDPKARARMAAAGQQLVDGKGAQRVATRILAEVGHNSGRFYGGHGTGTLI